MDAVDKIGLGIDLLGGSNTLGELKAIRAEMEAIANLGRGKGPSIYGPTREDEAKTEQFIKATEKAQMDSIKRIAKAKAEAMRFIDPDEPAVLNAKVARRREVERRANQQTQQELLQTEGINKRINDRAARDKEVQLEKDLRGYARLRQVLEENTRANRKAIVEEGQLREQQYKQEIAQRKARLQELVAAGKGVEDPTLRQRLRAVRNDSFSRSDPTTQGYRNDLATELRAERILRDNQSKANIKLAEQEAQRISIIESQARSRRNQEYIQDSIKRRELAHATDPEIGASIDLSNRLIAGSTKGSNTLKGNTSIDSTLIPSANRLRGEFDALGRKATDFRRELNDLNRTRPITEITADLRGVEKEQDAVLRKFKELNRANNAIPVGERRTIGNGGNAGGGGGGGRGRGGSGGGPPNDPSLQLRDPQGLFNEKGFFTTGDAVGRITRNILLYQAVSLLTYGLGNYIEKSIEAAKRTVEYGNALRFATEQAGGDVGANERLADSLQTVGLSRQQGRQAVTEAARFAINRPQDTEALTRTVTNIAASRGLGIDKSDELIEQLRRRESKFFKRIFGTTVESIYTDAAAQKVDSSRQQRNDLTSVTIGSDGPIKSRQAEISKYVESMDDAQKETAVFNYILNQSSRFEDEAAQRALTLAGRLDKISASFANAQEGVGLFITDLKPVNDLLDLLASKAGILDKLRAPTINRTGTGGSISDLDVRQYSIDKTTGFRANALNEINNFGTQAVLGGAAVGGLALLGRGQAKEIVRRDSYVKAFDQFKTEFNGNLTAAQNEAVRVSKELKPGLVRSVGQGVNRLTLGVTDSVRNSLNLDPLQRTGASAVYAPSSPYGASLQAKGAFSPLLRGNDLRDLGRIQSFGNVAGGLTGGIIGASLGSLVAEKLNVGPITATGLTIAGGIAGTTIGTTIGSVIATTITTKIAAAGGFGGLIAGTTTGGAIASEGGLSALLGSSVGGAAGAGAIGAGAIASIVLAGLTVGGALGAAINYLNPYDALSNEQKSIDRGNAAGEADAIRRRELQNATDEGRVRYRDLAQGSATFNQLFSEREAKSIDLNGFGRGFGNQYRRFSQETLQGIDPRLKANDAVSIARQQADVESQISKDYKSRLDVEERLGQLRRRDLTLPENKDIPEEIKGLERQLSLYEQLNKLKEKGQLVSEFGTTDPERIKTLSEYRARIDNENQRSREKAKAERDKQVQEQSLALSKLRDASAGSFKLVGDIGTALTGPDNQFTKILADQITSAERMRQQWGFLGDAAVKYFDTLEQKALARQLNAAEFGSYTQSSNLIGRADKEAADRSNPNTLSRKDQEYLDIQSAIVERAKQIPTLWRQAADVLRITLTPQQELAGQLNLLTQAFGVSGPTVRNAFGQDITNRDNVRRNAFGQSLGGFYDIQTRRNALGQSLEDPSSTSAFSSVGRGESPEVSKLLRKNFADSIVDAFKNYTPAQIRQSGLQDFYIGAIKSQGLSLIDNITSAQQKAQFGAREDVRLQQQLEADTQFRARQIAAGRDPKDVGRESDRLLLSRTDGIPIKDLSFDQFAGRQEAQRREAERAVQDQADAKAAVQQGLSYQKELLDTVKDLRAQVLAGNMSVLLQVQNDTQARIDQNSLEAISGQSVGLDQRSVKSSSYTPSTEKYKRTGGEYGLTNR